MKIIPSFNPLFSNYRKWQLLPFLVLGLMIFYLNSLIEINDFFKYYLVILEIQTSMVALYLILPKFKKSRNKYN